MKPSNLMSPPKQPPKRSKYKNVRVRIDGINFDSGKEGRYYLKLRAMQEAGMVLYWHRQVIFDLAEKATYRCDFQVFYPDGSVRYIDVKGFKTKEYILKKKLVRRLYGVDIEEA